jgi:hypothetical protein
VRPSSLPPPACFAARAWALARSISLWLPRVIVTYFAERHRRAMHVTVAMPSSRAKAGDLALKQSVMIALGLRTSWLALEEAR